MIRTYQPADLDRLMQLWLQGNLQAHPFVPASYWEENAADVRRQLPQARLFLYEDAEGVQGFLGLVDGYIAGIFVDAAARHLLILLTDASPNDSRRIPPSPDDPLGRDYGGSAGVEDAAAEVRALQRKGLRVSAVFMGEDASAADASRIYGKNMARIRGMDQLARAAGRLIQNEIRELGD